MKSIILSFMCVLPLFGECQTIELTEEEKRAFEDMAFEKTEALSNYISTICDKDKETAEKIRVIDQAVNLFMDEERIVQVSSKNRETVRRQKIRPYLNHLRVLKYERVEITWYDVGYVSNLKRGTDGRYSATITVFQKFVGYGADNTVAYEDVTKKNIEVIVDTQMLRIGDIEREELVVRLSDIAVVETR